MPRLNRFTAISTLLAVTYPIALLAWGARWPESLPVLTSAAAVLSLVVALGMRAAPEGVSPGTARPTEIQQQVWLLVAAALCVPGGAVFGRSVILLLARVIGKSGVIDELPGLLSEGFGVMLAGYAIGRAVPWSSELFAWVGSTSYVLKRSIEVPGYESYQFASEFSAKFRPDLPEWTSGEAYPWVLMAIGLYVLLAIVGCRAGANARAAKNSSAPKSVSWSAVLGIALAAASLYVGVLAISPDISIRLLGISTYGPGAERYKEEDGQVLEIGLEVEARNSGTVPATLTGFTFESSALAGGAMASLKSNDSSFTDRSTGKAIEETSMVLGPGEIHPFHITFTVRQGIDGETLFQAFRRIRLNQRAMLIPGVPAQSSVIFLPRLSAVDAAGHTHKSAPVIFGSHYDPPMEDHVVSEFWFDRDQSPSRFVVNPWDVVRPTSDGASGRERQ